MKMDCSVGWFLVIGGKSESSWDFGGKGKDRVCVCFGKGD